MGKHTKAKQNGSLCQQQAIGEFATELPDLCYFVSKKIASTEVINGPKGYTDYIKEKSRDQKGILHIYYSLFKHLTFDTSIEL